MRCIKIITDSDLGLEEIPFDRPGIRKGARGIVINHEGHIALLNKAVKHEYKLPGGGLEDGEDPRAAFIREVMEETGCEAEITNELGTIEEHKSQGNFKQISYLFVGKVRKNTNRLHLTSKEKDEGAKLIWADEKEALRLITDCYEKLAPSQYEDVYFSKFIVLRDKEILQYYLRHK